MGHILDTYACVDLVAAPEAVVALVGWARGRDVEKALVYS